MSRGVAEAVAGAPLYFMTSAGGLVRAEAFRGRDAVVSGPAGGVVGVARTARGGRRRGRARLRHGRHLHRRLPLRRRAGAARHGQGRRREAAQPDAGRGDGGGRRRLDPDLRRPARPRRARPAPAPIPGPACLRPRRPGHRHRRQPGAGPARPAASSRRCSGPDGDQPLDAAAAARAPGRAGRRPWARPASRPPPRASSPSPSSRWPRPCGASPPSAASTRATTPWSPSAARPARSPARSPRRWASSEVLCPRYASVLSAWGIGQAQVTALRQAGPGGGRWTRRAWPRADGAWPSVWRPRRAPALADAGRRRRRRSAARLRLRYDGADAELPVALGDAREAPRPRSRPPTSACSASSSRTAPILIASVEAEASKSAHPGEGGTQADVGQRRRSRDPSTWVARFPADERDGDVAHGAWHDAPVIAADASPPSTAPP